MHRIFWNGPYGGKMEVLDVKGPKQVFAFERKGDVENAVVMINFSSNPVAFKLKNKKLKGKYFDYFTKNSDEIKEPIMLPPYGYLVLIEEI
jgi:pullulanase/glycogen debranching enzyme